MMKITGLSHLFKWENLHNWWLTKYFFATLYILTSIYLLSHIMSQKICAQHIRMISKGSCDTEEWSNFLHHITFNIN